MQLTFHGAARTVTGSRYLLATGKRRILIDCGLFQGTPEDEDRFNRLAFDPREVDYAVMTHGHLDHVGLLPLLPRGGFAGRVLSTPATRDVAMVILRDAARLNEREGGAARFGTGDVESLLAKWTDVPYLAEHDLGGGVTLRFHDAGHILGSAIVELTVREGPVRKRVVFSGDLGRPGSPILRDPAKIAGAEVLQIESTYGDRVHDTAQNREQLKQIVHQIAAERGRLLIPAFGVGRTQTLLYVLNDLVEKGEVPRLPVFLDSPLGSHVTRIYRDHPECYDAKARTLIERGDAPFDFPGLRETLNHHESRRIEHVPGPVIIIAGSGMMQGGRIVSHLQRHLGEPSTTVLVIGYQAQGTLGRRLQDGADHVFLEGADVHVQARVKTLHGFSAHADRDELCAWLGQIAERPATIFCTHGEPPAATALAATINERFGIQPRIPAIGEVVEV